MFYVDDGIRDVCDGIRDISCCVERTRLTISRRTDAVRPFTAQRAERRVPGKQSAEYAHLVGDAVANGRPFTVDPPQCRPLLKPVDGLAVADRIGIGAGEGPDERGLVVSVDSPVNVPAGLPSTGCNRMSFHVEDDAVLTNGTAERLAAPDIDGAVTSAVKITINDYQYVDYVYIAILDNSTYVQAWARQYPDFQAAPLLPDLLSKAVTAIRG